MPRGACADAHREVGSLSDRTNPAMRGAPVESLPVAALQDRTLVAFTADRFEQVLAVVPGGVHLLVDCVSGQSGPGSGCRARWRPSDLGDPPFGPLQLERASRANRSPHTGGRQRLEALSRMVDSGQLRPQVEAVLPFGRVREALGRVAGRHTHVARSCSRSGSSAKASALPFRRTPV
jgi:hypothetical protein